MTLIESDVARLWAEVLGAEPSGPQCDFFRSGGDSILAARLVARAGACHGVDVSLAGSAADPTPAGLPGAIQSARAQVALASPVALGTPAAGNGARPLAPRCSLAQERFWFIDQATGGHPVSHVPWALRLHGAVEAEALGRALQVVGRRHETLRTRFALQDGRPVQVIDRSARV